MFWFSMCCCRDGAEKDVRSCAFRGTTSRTTRALGKGQGYFRDVSAECLPVDYAEPGQTTSACPSLFP